MNETKALIIGGGIAGTLAAIGLRRVGIHAEIFEAYAETPSAGSWLTVAVNGLAAMQQLGVHEQVKACGFASEQIELVTGAGKRLGVLPIGGRLSDGTVTHTMKRADLHDCLARHARTLGITTHYQKRMTRIDGSTVHFADGSTVSGDLIIGADGVRSQVRAQIDSVRARYNGLGNIGGFAPAIATVEPGTYRMVFGKRAFFGYTAAPTGEVWWFANTPNKRELSRETIASTDWRAHLLDLFADDAGPMCDLIRNTPGTFAYTNQYDLPRVRTWTKDNIVLIGDAAHAAAPSSGQGASMAAEDAVTLALCLSRGFSLDRFVELRRARAERVVAYGRRSSNSKTAGPIGRVVRDAILPHVFRWLAGPKAQAQQAWLYDVTHAERTHSAKSAATA